MKAKFKLMFLLAVLSASAGCAYHGGSREAVAVSSAEIEPDCQYTGNTERTYRNPFLRERRIGNSSCNSTR